MRAETIPERQPKPLQVRHELDILLPYFFKLHYARNITPPPSPRADAVWHLADETFYSSPFEQSIFIRQHFRPILQALAKCGVTDPQLIVEFCDNNTSDMTKKDLVNPDSGELDDITELLPPLDVIQAMQETWADGQSRRLRCESLEKFIQQHRVFTMRRDVSGASPTEL